MWQQLFVNFLLLFLVNVRGMVDLFQTKVSAFRNGVLEEVGCESLILQNFKQRNGTGVKVFRTTEKDLSLCPNLCDLPENKNKFCSKNEPEFVEAFSADIRSDRCCDERSCKCVCHYVCNTFETKLESYKASGYNKCKWGTSKKEILEKAKQFCNQYEDKLKCKETVTKSFVCPRQFVCVGEKCLSCINPSCIPEEDKSKAKLLIASFNKTEVENISQIQKEMSEGHVESDNKDYGMRHDAYRSLNENPKSEIQKVEAGVLF